MTPEEFERWCEENGYMHEGGVLDRDKYAELYAAIEKMPANERTFQLPDLKERKA